MPHEIRPELFADVAEQFEKLEQPLNLQWMADRRVTLEEVNALSQKIALILRGYGALTPQQRILFITQGVFELHPHAESTPIGQRQIDSSQ